MSPFVNFSGSKSYEEDIWSFGTYGNLLKELNLAELWQCNHQRMLRYQGATF